MIWAAEQMALQGSNPKQQTEDASPGSSFGTIGSNTGNAYQVHLSAVPDAAPNFANQFSDSNVHTPQQGSADGMPTYQQSLALSMRGLDMNGIAAVSPHRMTHEETLPQVMSMSGVHSEFPVGSAGVKQQQQDWYRAQMQPSNGSIIDEAPQVRYRILRAGIELGINFRLHIDHHPPGFRLEPGMRLLCVGVQWNARDQFLAGCNLA